MKLLHNTYCHVEGVYESRDKVYNRYRKLTANKEQKLFIKEVSALSWCEIASINFDKSIKLAFALEKSLYHCLIVKPVMVVACCVN